MQALHEAISALSLQLFNFSFKRNTAEVCRSYLSFAHHTHTAQVRTNNFLCFFFFTAKIRRLRGAAWCIS